MSTKPNPIDQDLIKSKLTYDQYTGIFTWKKSGKEAGFNHKSSGYRLIKINYKHYQAHRLAWCYVNGDTEKSIDHINGDRLDNRIDNLRVVTASENQRNQKLFVTNKSGSHGVHWHAASSRWRAVISVCGVAKYLGYFSSKDDAISCRKMAEKEYGYHENHGKR